MNFVKSGFGNPVQNCTLQEDLYRISGDCLTGSRSISWTILLTYLLVFRLLWFSMTSTPPSCSAPTRNLQVATLISSSLRILAIPPDAHLFPSLIMWRRCFPFQRCGDCHLYVSFQEHMPHCSIVCMLRGGPDPIIAECQLCLIQF